MRLLTGWRWLAAVVVLTALPSSLRANEESAAVSDADLEDAEERTSEALRSKQADWADSGFRLALGFGYENLIGDSSAVSMSAAAASIHAGWRFSERWALSIELRYTIPITAFQGVRWSATVEPVFFIIDALSVSIAAGYGGLWGDRSPRVFYNYAAAVDLLRGPNPNPALPPFRRCDGDGPVTNLKVAYLFTVGDLFSTGPQLRLGGQWTRCGDDEFITGSQSFDPGNDGLGSKDADLAPHQWWLHLTLGVNWMVAWR